MSDKRVSIGAELTGLPLGQMLAGPLEAAVDAQSRSAIATASFINDIALDPQGNVRVVPFNYNKTFTNAETGISSQKSVELSVPMISLIQVPSIKIADLSINFEFKIRDSFSKETEFNLGIANETELELSQKTSVAISGPIKFLQGSVKGETASRFRTKLNVSATYRSATRSETDRSATMGMTMQAKNETPEGLRRVLDIFADSITAQAEAAV